MWVVSTRGFYSVVQDRSDPDRVLVRARAKADLVALEEYRPGVKKEMWQDLRADYPWRLNLARADWLMILTQLTLDVDYDNFKSAVARGPGGWKRSSVYHAVWSALLAIEGKSKFWNRYMGPRWDEGDSWEDMAFPGPDADIINDDDYLAFPEEAQKKKRNKRKGKRGRR